MWLRNIPIPPSSNISYPTNKWTGRRFKSKDLVLWEKAFYDWALLNRQAVQIAREEFKDPKPMRMVHIDTLFYLARERILTKDGRAKKIDATNLLKHLHDSIANLIELDDCWFWAGTFSKSILTNSIHEHCHVKLQWREIVVEPTESLESQ